MNFSWYFDLRGIRHVTCNNVLLVSLKNSPYKNAIIIGRGKKPPCNWRRKHDCKIQNYGNNTHI